MTENRDHTFTIVVLAVVLGILGTLYAESKLRPSAPRVQEVNQVPFEKGQGR